MIVSIGEILLDMIGTDIPSGIDFETHAGGAPLNVAAQIAKFGGNAYFVGSIGNDIPGQFLTKYIETLPLTGYKLKKIEDRNTTLAFVTLSNGERDFCFYRKHTADYILPKLDVTLLKKENIVHIGSLMLSEKEGLDYALKIADEAKSHGCLVSFDVNFRKDIYSSVDEAISRSKLIMEKADLIKMSEDEITIFGHDYFESLIQSRHVFLTKGKQGSAYFYKDETVEVPTYPVKPIDSTGAGDAFYGAILSQIDKNKSFAISDIEEMLKLANACGALATLGKGAIAPLASLDEALAFISNGGKK